MLKQSTLDLVKSEENNFKKLFSISIVKSYSYQRRFIDYVGKYSKWNTNVKEGTLLLDNRKFNVEYIGTTSNSDNYWYSADFEKQIPAEYVNLIIQAKENLQKLNINSLATEKITLDDEEETLINGYNLSLIYMAFAPVNTALFKGSGPTSIYMFVKDLPEKVFERITKDEFPFIVMEILESFNVEHKLMIKALANEFDYTYREIDNNIEVTFSENSKLIFKFNGKYLENISGELK
ncbi:hypothetical protein H8356DRAFT_102336 [Neocallimastix lanati (nom. inval.)]|jgi:hypothetical protein|uniref:Uncharacterized protein n=1 Tax=Neocallimastix californiae TaxID=1754190 RepID=A0A1Y2F5P2_9FUNG|nr:hypothetical protein H8356DRAFT_102336 [Neocallimastix sp. JGI-2020a]ORY79212.1 hypothetical protein LY90DRAFT_698189 [Neocallimastix californiae]|eukprot:ORY79212.1 hypothetical protein LY90DRAFT_698189 [Neocallimastix californiae]